MNKWVTQISEGGELSAGDVASVVADLVSDSHGVSEKAAFLSALARRGETPNEITAFARELLARSLPLPLPEGFTETQELLDVCGTGGDRLNTYNISTTVALICAAAGVRVAKHGNRAVTSASGSADVLEALGIPINSTPAEAARAIETHGFAFLFAPLFHPAFRGIGPARRWCAEQGQRTIFNFLGPLLNPARPSVQLVGVSRPELTGPMARTLQHLGLRRAMVVSGRVRLDDGVTAFLDELSTLGDNSIAEFHQARAFSESIWHSDGLPLGPAALADLAGGNAVENAAIIMGIFEGAIVGPKLEAALLNAAAALFVAGKVRSIAEGWELAAETVRSGAAREKLRVLRG